MQLLSPRCGILECGESDALHVAEGIAPFDRATRFVMVAREEEWPFAWLQSLDEPALAFVVAPLELLFPDRAEEALNAYGGSDEACDSCHLAAYGIVVLDRDPAKLTINLLAPLVVDFERKQARQLLLDGPLEQTRELLEPALRSLAHA